MQQSILHISLLVEDYDEAISFYVDKLNFVLIEDTPLDDVKRWVVVAPRGDGVMSILLAKAQTTDEKKQIGDQSGGRVFLFLATDNFTRDYEQMLAKGVEFVREPEVQEYGTVAVFKDLYGNLWDLLQPGVKHSMYAKLNRRIHESN